MADLFDRAVCPLTVSSSRLDLLDGGLEMVRYLKKATLPLRDDNHHARLRIVVVEFRLPRKIPLGAPQLAVGRKAGQPVGLLQSRHGLQSKRSCRL
jgi:hypothetical protein